VLVGDNQIPADQKAGSLPPGTSIDAELTLKVSTAVSWKVAGLMNLALIVSAACGLFLDDGYVATRIERIAERVGVSKPTAFASVGNKRALLKAARDLAMAGDDEPVPIAERSWFQEALAEPDPGSRCGYMLET